MLQFVQAAEILALLSLPRDLGLTSPSPSTHKVLPTHADQKSQESLHVACERRSELRNGECLSVCHACSFAVQ